MKQYKKQTINLKLQKWIGSRIRKLRIERNMSQDNFAFDSKIQRGYISDLERGKRNISISNLKKICDFLGISLSDFFSEFKE